MVHRVQSIGEGIVSNRMKLNSGSKGSFACTIASAIGEGGTGIGRWNVWLLSFVLMSFALIARGADIDLSKTLKGVETHYNTAQSLILNFSETYTSRGHKRTEKGNL